RSPRSAQRRGLRQAAPGCAEHAARRPRQSDRTCVESTRGGPRAESGRSAAMTSRETDRTTRPFQAIADARLQLDNPCDAKLVDRLPSDVRNGEPLGVLTGEPGTGKTTILRRLITQLEWRGFRSVIQRVPVGLDDLEAILSTIAPERPLVVGLDE